MSENVPIEKTTYLLAWTGEVEETPSAFFEVSTPRLFRSQSVISAGMIRGKHRVIAFCDFVHGGDYLTKEELRLVATAWLDGEFNTVHINLRT